MHGFQYLCVYDRENKMNLVEIRDLTFQKSVLDYNFQAILETQGISLSNFEITSEFSDIQIHIEGNKNPFVYTFAKTPELIIVIVSNSPIGHIYNKMQKVLDEIQYILEDNRIGEEDTSNTAQYNQDLLNIRNENLEIHKQKLFENQKFLDNLFDFLNFLKEFQQNHLKIYPKIFTQLNNFENQNISEINPEKLQNNLDESNNLQQILPNLVIGTLPNPIPNFIPNDNELDTYAQIKFQNQLEEVDFHYKVSYLLGRHFATYLLTNFLVVEKRKDLLSKYSNLNFFRSLENEIFKIIDGTRTIEEIIDVVKRSDKIKSNSKENTLKNEMWFIYDTMFYFWVNDLVYFRFKYHSWNIFRSTVKAPLYLEDGVESIK